MKVQGRRCRDKVQLNNPANSGLLVENQEISVRARMRGGAGRTPTPNQAVMKQVALRTIRDRLSLEAQGALGWRYGAACYDTKGRKITVNELRRTGSGRTSKPRSKKSRRV